MRKGDRKTSSKTKLQISTNSREFKVWKTSIFTDRDIADVIGRIGLRSRIPGEVSTSELELFALQTCSIFEEWGEYACVSVTQEGDDELTKRYREIAALSSDILERLSFARVTELEVDRAAYDTNFLPDYHPFEILAVSIKKSDMHEARTIQSLPAQLAALGLKAATLADRIEAGFKLSVLNSKAVTDLSTFSCDEAETTDPKNDLLRRLVVLYLDSFQDEPLLKKDGVRNIDSPLLKWCKAILKAAWDQVPTALIPNCYPVVEMIQELRSLSDDTLLKKLSDMYKSIRKGNKLRAKIVADYLDDQEEFIKSRP